MLEDEELDKIISQKQEQNVVESAVEQTERHVAEAISNEVKQDEQSENSNLPSVKTDEQALVDFKNAAIGSIVAKFKTGKLDTDEGLKEFVNAVAIVKAVEDPKLNDQLIKNAADSLKSYTKANTYKDNQKKIERRTKRNEAFYKAFRPILEFDLSHLIGKKKKKIVEKDPTTRKKTIRYEDIECQQKTYEDRSYGMCLMIIMIALFIIPYSICNLVLAVFNGINALFECFNNFGRTAFWISTSIAGIAIIGLFIYVILLIIQAAFGVQIFA